MNYYANNFWIYRNGVPYSNNNYLLSPIGKYVYSVINYLHITKKIPFAIDSIIVTSQYRTIGRHATNLAIDITAQPIQIIPVLWILLHQYTTLNVILSLHDRHIHIDYLDNTPTTGKNFKGLEELAPTRTEQGNLQFYFRRPQEKYLQQVKELYRLYTDNNILTYVYKYFLEYRSETNKLSTNISMFKLYTEKTKETTKELYQDTKNFVEKNITITLLLLLGVTGYYIYTKTKGDKNENN